MDKKIEGWLFNHALNNATLIRSSRHAAAIVRKKWTMAVGVNQMKTHPIMMQWGKNDKSIYLHAEIDAIVNFLRHYRDPDLLTECEMYVVRVNKKHEVCCSEPCEGCMAAIRAFGFKGVYWS